MSTLARYCKIVNSLTSNYSLMLEYYAEATEVVTWVLQLTWEQLICITVATMLCFGLIRWFLNWLYGKSDWPSVQVWIAKDERTIHEIPWMYRTFFITPSFFSFKFHNLLLILFFPFALLVSGAEILYNITSFILKIVWTVVLLLLTNYRTIIGGFFLLKTMQAASIDTLVSSTCADLIQAKMNTTSPGVKVVTIVV